MSLTILSIWGMIRISVDHLWKKGSRPMKHCKPIHSQLAHFLFSPSSPLLWSLMSIYIVSFHFALFMLPVLLQWCFLFVLFAFIVFPFPFLFLLGALCFYFLCFTLCFSSFCILFLYCSLPSFWFFMFLLLSVLLCVFFLSVIVFIDQPDAQDWRWRWP